jgi:hypothetical protein
MKHLKDVNLSYFGHMKKAFEHIWNCQKVSFKLLVHAFILEISLSDDIIKIWDDLQSIKEAGMNYKFISQVCRGKRKSAFGFKWKFFENL